MKTRLIFLIAFVFVVKMSNAQTSVFGGVNFANMKFSSGGFSFSPKSIVGYHFGIGSDFALKNNLYINTGLQFSLKGFKVEQGLMDETFGGKDLLSYLEVPINLMYKHQLRNASKIFVHAGPYIGCALKGKEKTNEGTVDFEFGTDNYRRADYGLGIGGGAEFGRIIAKLNYQLGLANIIDVSEVKVRNRVFQISVGYIISRKK